MDAGASLDTAGTVAFNRNDGKALDHWVLMLYSEWEAGKKAFDSLVTKTGLSLRVTHRVGFDGEAAAQWDDIEPVSNDRVACTYSQMLKEGNPDSR